MWREVQAAWAVDRSILNLENGGLQPAAAYVNQSFWESWRYANEAPSYTNARILWRSAGFQVDFVDPLRVQRSGRTCAVGDLVEYRTGLAKDCHRRDRVHTYGSFYIADLPA